MAEVRPPTRLSTSDGDRGRVLATIWSLKTLFIHYYIMEMIIIQLDHKFSAGRTISYTSSAFCSADKYNTW